MGPFTLDFMVRALVAGLMIGAMAPMVGIYIVQKQLSLLGDGLGHVAIAGVGLALMTGQAPVPVAVAVCVTGAVVIELLRQSGKASGDVGLAILFYGGLASGVLMAGEAGNGAASLSQFLFGSLTTVSRADLIVVGAMGALVMLGAFGLAPQLFAVTADEDYARTQGLPTRVLNLLVVVLAATTVALSMRTVGLMLVSALMVIPVATAQNLVSGFARTLVVSVGLGLTISFGGVVGSYYLDSATGATIVVLAIVVFICSLPIRTLLATRHRQSQISNAEHGIFERAEPHDGQGEHRLDPAVLQGDHVGYLVNGHRHAPHGDHCDKH